jgi:hypothetical protein
MSDADEVIEETVDEQEVTETQEAPADWKAEAGIAGNPAYDKFQTLSDFAKSHAELESFRGNSIRIPSEDAGEEQIKEFTEKLMKVPGVMRMPGEDDAEGWNNIYQQMGRPSAPDGYQFDEVPGFAGDPESEGAFRQLAHEHGLTAKQANAVYGWLAGNIAEEDTAAGQQSEEAMGRLKGEWGQAFDHKLQSAQAAAAQLEKQVPGISEYFDGMAEKGYDANMIRLMDVVAGLMGESGAIQTSPRTGMTPDEARARISDIRNNPDHPANNDMDPQHEAARQEVIRLYKVANP